MNIFNVRFGFAMNSSSTHSLIFLNDKNLRDNYDEGGFGWDNFTIVSEQGKKHYLAAQLYAELGNIIPDCDLSKTLLQDLLCDYDLDDFDSYVDHQSTCTFPRGFGKELPDMDFFKDMEKYVLQDGLVILGGNDNGGDHPLGYGFTLAIPQDTRPGKYITRKDPEFHYWTLFSPQDGTKMRISFDNDPENNHEPTKAFAPELVDMKITDYCGFGCSFCYQGSTTKGQHASKGKVFEYIDSLAELKVFEIAYGGGEPTHHPDFFDIIEYTKSKGITPNFTTKDLAWIQDNEKRNQVFNNVGGFAYSVQCAQDIGNLEQAMAPYKGQYGSFPVNVTAQLVMGTVTREEFENIIKAAEKARIRVTLLGFKTTKRGEHYPQIKYDWWLKLLQDLFAQNQVKGEFAIDTALAKDFKDKLKEAGIPSWMYHIEEGKFSCYIDAVEKKIAPSSYCEDDEYVSFESLSPIDIVAEFKAF